MATQAVVARRERRADVVYAGFFRKVHVLGEAG
jgi:hypothetical protein